MSERRPRCAFATANSRILATSLSRYGFGGAVRRCVLRCWPATRQTRRSETSITIVTCSIARRRRPRLKHVAQNFPLAISFRIWMSSCWSATRRFSREFYFSRSFRRCTASRSTAPYSARHWCSVTSDTRSDLATSAIGVPFAMASSACSASRQPPRDGDASCSNASSETPLGPVGRENLSYGVDLFSALISI